MLARFHAVDGWPGKTAVSRKLWALADEHTEFDRWHTMRHSFTHYDLDIQPVAVRLSAQSSTVRDTEDRIWYEIGSPAPGGMAAPVSKLLQTLRNR